MRPPEQPKPTRTKDDDKDLWAVRQHVWLLERELTSFRTFLMLHEAAQSNGERPPKHVRGLRKVIR